MIVSTIPHVLNKLDEIILWCENAGSRQGYFAALYRRMTLAVLEEMLQNGFADNTRMEKLDVIFASRYIDAWSAYQNKQSISKGWQAAFSSCENSGLTVIQHLILGVNTHINLDLSIAAADTCVGTNILDLQSDYEKINNIIHEMNGVDIIILSASTGEINEELIPSIENDIIKINVRGYLQVLIAAWHYFAERGHGQIAGITSIAAIRGNKMAPAYNASKAFQSSYLEALRVKSKFRNSNIKITELIPGFVRTAMGKGDRMFWVSSVEKAACQCKRAIDKKRQKAYITKRWWLIYLLLKFLPIFIYDPLMNAAWKMKRKS